MESLPTFPLINKTFPTNNQSLLTLGSINANCSILKNSSQYLQFIQEYNIDFLMIQEAGHWVSTQSVQENNSDLNPPFDFFKAGFSSYSTINSNPHHNLVILFKSSFAPFLTKLPTIDPNILSVTLSPPFNIEFHNIYAQHSKSAVAATNSSLLKILKTNNQPRKIISGDFNSYSNSDLDYFTTGILYPKKFDKRWFNERLI
jgi:hypothetical protein